MDNVEATVEMWDIGGADNQYTGQSQLRSFTYVQWDAVFICFSIESEINLISVLQKVKD